MDTKDNSETENGEANRHNQRQAMVSTSSNVATAGREAQHTDLEDLHTVFNASLRFKSPIPAPRPIENRRSFGSSLYPSVASLTDLTTTVDVERNWEAAGKASMRKKASTQQERQISTRSSTRMASGAATAVAAVSPVASVASFSSPLPAVAARASGPASSDDDDLLAQKLAAYGVESASIYQDQPAHSVAAMPMPNRKEEEDEMLEMKIAAYEGRDVGTHSTATAAQAEATVVEEFVHPSDISTNAVQAEYMAPAALSDEEHRSQHFSALTTAVQEVSPSTTAEATVLASGPMVKATAEAWGAAPAAEATVLQDDSLQSNVVDLDSKPPARSSLVQPWMQTEALETDAAQQAEVTAVEYEVHPSEIPAEAVQAEFVGQDFEAAAEVSGNGQAELVAAQGAQVSEISDETTYEINGNQVEEETITEVAVIESGPMDKATAEAWSAAPSREAQVLEQTTAVAAAAIDTKLLSADDTETWEADAPGENEYGMMAGEAEVVGITEDVHPAEFLEATSAQAELIGSDFNTAIAVPSTATSGATQGEETMEASIILENGAEVSPYDTALNQRHVDPQEAHATLLNEGEYTNFDEQSSEVAAVTAVFEGTSSSHGDASGQLPATPVAVLQDTSTSASPAMSFRDPIKPQPFSGRTISPSATPSEPASYTDSFSSLSRHTLAEIDVASGTPIAHDQTPLHNGSSTPQCSMSPPPVPSPVSMGAAVPSTSRSSRNSARTNSSAHSDSTSQGFQTLSSNFARGANNVMETLFGNAKPGIRRQHALADFDPEKIGGSILPRTLLPSSVIYSEATNSWVATVNTNQKALEANNVEESSKALRAFSVPTQKQAMALASAWAPPQMHSFSSNPTCFICESQFAVFRRACHCRNCGVCICGPCSVQWPSKMLPATYNIKRETIVSICKACDWLCSAFRLALLQGDHDKALALYSTGNINLTTPFANVKGELFYPVHCAVLGGNLKLLKWLVDDHCCPLRSIRISNGKQKNSAGSYTPILTSKGRSLLGIALGNRNIGIVRYLVVEKRMLLSAEKGLSVEVLAQNLDLVLRVLPEEVLGEQTLDNIGRTSIGGGSTRSTNGMIESHTDIDIATIGVEAELDGQADASADNECIICFDNRINCVFTPCGHQICCMECGNHISRCPVCAVDCTPMRVFKP